MWSHLFSNLLFVVLVASLCFFITNSAKHNVQPKKVTVPPTVVPSGDYYYDIDDKPVSTQHPLNPSNKKQHIEENPVDSENNQNVNHQYTKPPVQRKTEKFPNDLFMDSEKTYFVQWKTNLTHITFEVQVKTLGWVGLGLSPTGGMPNSDIVVMWVVDGKLTMQDRYAYEFAEPHHDEQEDWIPLYGYENGTHTIVGFSRLLDTCDKEMDRIITRDTVHLLYAYHSLDPPNNQLMKHEHRGSRNVYLLDSIPDFVEPNHTKKIIVTAKKYHVPHESDTTYRCVIQQLKDIDKKYHLIGVKPQIEEGSKDVVHHMLLHLCDSGFKNSKQVEQFMCYDDPVNSRVMVHCFSFLLTAWAVGGPGYLYPKDLGLPLGPEMNGRLMVLETHYNNPHHTKGIVDSSGVVLYLTDNLRKTETGQLFGGSFDFNWGIMIPPKQKEFTIYGLCNSECTNNMVFPKEGITIFSFFLHTHLAGVKIRVKIIRNGKELQSIMKDDNFDFNYQENRNLVEPIKLMRGDTILTECIYSTENRQDYTFGGLKTSDEMCLIFFSYYPKTEFTVCGSFTHYPSLISTFKLKNTNMSDFTAAKRINFTWDQNTKQIVVDQMNTTRRKSPKAVKKLANYYRNAEFEIACRYMALPQFLKSKIPQYTPYIQPPSECDSTQDN